MARSLGRTGLIAAITFVLSIIPFGCAEGTPEVSPPPAPAAVTQPADAPSTQPVDPAWADIARTLERPGTLKNDVYTITVPRDDLDVFIDGMSIPTAAGLASTFYFYRCPCGKMNVAGQFVATDYEANDVVDAVRQNATLKVATQAPMFLYDRPRLLLVRIQGEGDPVAMAKVIREALRWTGKERMAPQPLNVDPGK